VSTSSNSDGQLATEVIGYGSALFFRPFSANSGLDQTLATRDPWRRRRVDHPLHLPRQFMSLLNGGKPRRELEAEATRFRERELQLSLAEGHGARIDQRQQLSALREGGTAHGASS
jgi:hypothetical protein